MKLHDNDTVFDNFNASDGNSSMNSRMLAVVLIALPCLIIVFGLSIDTLIGLSDTNFVYLLFFIPTALVLLNRLLLKNNSSQLRIASRWTLKSYKESIAGLDERERQAIDQAYRMSYRTIALVCWLAFAGVFANIYIWHLTYHPGQIGVFFILFGIIDLVSYLPTAIVVWNEKG